VRAIIVDDEPRAREVLRYYLEKVGGVEVVGEAATGGEAVDLVREAAPEAAFLDIRLPDLSGMELVHLLRRLAPGLRVVFVTAYENHAVAAFAAEAVDYLVKPLNAARVLQTVERLLRPRPSPAAVSPASDAAPLRVPIEVGDGRARRTILLTVPAILAIEARGKGTAVRTAREEYETSVGLSAWEALLPAESFLRVHRGFLVNLQAVRELFTEGRATFLRLDGRPEAVPVSRERLPGLRHRLFLPE
jgi:DNA-binding LytR/AlgR family response regulator